MLKYFADLKSRNGLNDDSCEEELEEDGENCDLCDEFMILSRPTREGIWIHYGVIISGN